MAKKHKPKDEEKDKKSLEEKYEFTEAAKNQNEESFSVDLSFEELIKLSVSKKMKK